MTRGRILIGELEHDLTHLRPFPITVTPKAQDAPSYRVLVSFGHHTFTRAFDEDVDNPDHRYEEDGDVRCFCQDRYLASKGLPSLIRQGAAGRAYFSQTRNYMLIDQPLGGAPYAVFFNIERAKALKGIEVTMFVVSAYEKPGLPARSRLPAISFATLVSKTARGEAVKRPKK